MNVYDNVLIPSKLNIENQDLCIGLFDGVHLGHKKLISLMKEKNNKSNILTFSTKLNKNNDNKFLLTENEKLDIFRKLNIDKVFIIDFNDKIRNLSKDDFISFLIKNKLKNIIVGSDFTFGKNKEGKASDLLDVNNSHIEICDLLTCDNIKVSTTKIKELLSSGDITLANKFLGYNYSFSSNVIKGYSRGSKLGYKTINQKVIESKLLPKVGVYMTYAIISGKRYLSMTNIGYVPTFNNNSLSIETHVINENIDLKVNYITIEFIKYIRNEIKFKNEKELINQLNKDKEEILNISKL